MRVTMLAVPPLLACSLLTACSGSGKDTGSPTSPSSSRPATASRTGQPTGPTNPLDGADPLLSGCSKVAASVPGAVVIKMPDGKVYGILRLRASAACHTAWGRVEAIKFRDVNLHIDAVRPVDHKTLLFNTTTATARENVFGRMLAYSPTKCVGAKAYVEGGPVARTVCFKG